MDSPSARHAGRGSAGERPPGTSSRGGSVAGGSEGSTGPQVDNQIGSTADSLAGAPTDGRAAIRDFLATRRAKITPEQAGLFSGGGRRRVPGLRREEVAVLAGISTEWYVRLEKGHLTGASDEVLDAVARALQLDDAERSHLFDLARADRPRALTRRRPREVVRPSLQRMLAAMPGSPAFIRNGVLDVLAINPLGRALYQLAFDDPRRPANLARFAFLDPRARDFYPGWDDLATATVAVLRTEAGRNPRSRALIGLVGELATTSHEFRTRWATHDVRLHQSGVKSFEHPVVGWLEVSFDSMPLPADSGLTMTVYTAEDGSASADALALLASWALTEVSESDDLDVSPVEPPAS